MATRLTTWIREQITKDVVRHRFADAALELVKDRAALAVDVYNDVYSEAERKKMAALPSGWLGEDRDITVQFGDGRGYEKLSFSGAVYGEVSTVLKDSIEPVDLLVQHRHERGCAKVYELTHPFALRRDDLRARDKDMSEAIRTARRQVEAAVQKATTLNRLIELWPEIEPFASKYEDKPKHLPALPTSELNALLDLPVSEAA